MTLFTKTAAILASNPKQIHRKIRSLFITNAFNRKVDAAFLLLSILLFAECRKENIS